MVKDGIFLSNRYEVLSKIGAGGMADVYKGRDCMLNRYVAIKVLSFKVPRKMRNSMVSVLVRLTQVYRPAPYPFLAWSRMSRGCSL